MKLPGKITRKKAILLSLFFFFVVTVLLWAGFADVLVPYVKPDFTYTADILSQDNFYNIEKKAYDGAQRSVSHFYYEVLDYTSYATIQNSFDVRTVDGDPIISIEKQYAIEKTTGRHIPEQTEEHREGYLFAPRHLKKGEPFTYWHINYDVPAKMQFIESENLFGLEVYHYRTNFDGYEIDQTDSLGHLPGVPEKYNIKLDAELDIWVEPYTGYLVKYEDGATAYYYDVKSGRQMHPWNTFQNQYRSSSVKHHVSVAKRQKALFLFFDSIIPLFLFIFTISLLIALYSVRNAYVILVVGLVGIAYFCFDLVQTDIAREPLHVAISAWLPEGNDDYETAIRGFKDGLERSGYYEGVDVTYDVYHSTWDDINFNTFIKSIKEQDYDLVYSLTTPGTLKLQEQFDTSIPVVFSLVTYPEQSGIINSVKGSGNNYVGTRNWVPAGKQLATLKTAVPRVKNIAFVRSVNERNSEIQLKEMREAGELWGIDIIDISVHSVDALSSVLMRQSSRYDAIYASCDTKIQGGGEKIIGDMASKLSLPSFSCSRTGKDQGILLGLVADHYEMGLRAGEKATYILDGILPSALETDTISHPVLYVNKNVANEIGIELSQDILTNASIIIR